MTNRQYAEWIELKDRADKALRRYPVVLRVASGGKAYKRDAAVLKAWRELCADIQAIEEANAAELPEWQRQAVAGLKAKRGSDVDADTPTNTPLEASQDATEAVNGITTYPSINIEFLHRGSPTGRLWYLLRHIDKQGRGIVSRAEATAAFCDKASELHCMTPQRLGQVLRDGHDVTWRVANGNIYLFGAARVAALFGIDKLRGTNVSIPVADLLQGQKRARAALWATVHAGRKRARPIARKTLRDAFGIPESTQRAYDAEADTVRRQNIVIIPEAAAEDFSYTRRRIIKGRDVLTAHLPSTYTSPYEKAKAGRKSVVNKRLKGKHSNSHLVGNTHKQGNNQRRYFDNAEAAQKAANRGRDALHRTGSTLGINVCRKTRLEAAVVWELAL